MLAVTCATGAVLAGEERQQQLLSVAAGAGAALALDEIPLAIENQDVYWRREWATLAQFGIAMAISLALACRFLARWARELKSRA